MSDKMRFIVAPLAAAILSACAAGPNYRAPETRPAEKFDGVEATYSADAASSEKTLASFWQGFGDPELNKLIGQALMSNHDVRIALARVAEVRALRRDTAFDLAPSITASGGYTQTRASTPQTFAGAPRSTEYYDAGFDAFSEPAFFGRGRRRGAAAGAGVGAAEAAGRDTLVIVPAELTRGYFELRGFQQQLDVARRNVGNQQATLDLA